MIFSSSLLLLIFCLPLFSDFDCINGFFCAFCPGFLNISKCDNVTLFVTCHTTIYLDRRNLAQIWPLLWTIIYMSFRGPHAIHLLLLWRQKVWLGHIPTRPIYLRQWEYRGPLTPHGLPNSFHNIWLPNRFRRQCVVELQDVYFSL